MHWDLSREHVENVQEFGAGSNQTTYSADNEPEKVLKLPKQNKMKDIDGDWNDLEEFSLSKYLDSELPKFDDKIKKRGKKRKRNPMKVVHETENHIDKTKENDGVVNDGTDGELIEGLKQHKSGKVCIPRETQYRYVM